MEVLKLLIFLAAFGRFSGAADLDYDIQRNIYVVDRAGNTLMKFSPGGDSLDAINGYGTGSLQFDSPSGIVARQGNDIFVADYNNGRIQRFNRTLDYITTIYTANASNDNARFGYPRDVALTRQGDMLIVDGENSRILKLSPFGEFRGAFGDIKAGAGRLVEPARIEVDGSDNAYVLDQNRLIQFDPFGSYIRDFPLAPDIVPMAISIDQDTLLVIGQRDIHLYDLVTLSSAGHFLLEAPAVAARLIEGKIVALEEHRIVVYALPSGPEE